MVNFGMTVSAITRANGKGVDYTYTQNRILGGTYFADTKNALSFLLAIMRKPINMFKVMSSDTPFDIIIAHQPFTFCSLVIRGFINNIPVIYVFHSPSHEEYSLAHQNAFFIFRKINGIIRKYIERFCIKRAQKLITLSRYMAQKAINIHQVPDRAITIIPGGANLDKFKPLKNRKKIKSDLNLPSGKIHLFTLRNLDPRMGIANLIKAIRDLKNDGMRLHLLIGGEGPEKKKLQRIATRLNLEHEVTFAGFIHSNDLCRYYSAADFFILPTDKLEGFGLVTTEALACGTPVIATPVGGSIEILAPFNPSLLLNDASAEAMANGIKRIVSEYSNNDCKYKQLRKSCRDYAEKRYSWERHVEVLRNLAAEIVLQRLSEG